MFFIPAEASFGLFTESKGEKLDVFLNDEFWILLFVSLTGKLLLIKKDVCFEKSS